MVLNQRPKPARPSTSSRRIVFNRTLLGIFFARGCFLPSCVMAKITNYTCSNYEVEALEVHSVIYDVFKRALTNMKCNETAQRGSPSSSDLRYFFCGRNCENFASKLASGHQTNNWSGLSGLKSLEKDHKSPRIPIKENICCSLYREMRLQIRTRSKTGCFQVLQKPQLCVPSQPILRSQFLKSHHLKLI